MCEKPVLFLLDSGATHNFLSRRLCSEIGLDMYIGPSVKIRFANTATVEVDSFAKVCVNFGKVSKFLKFTILDCECLPILGMDFLKTTNPVIDWVNGEVTFLPRVQSDSCCFADDNVFAVLEVADVSGGTQRSISSSFGPHSVGSPMGQRYAKNEGVLLELPHSSGACGQLEHQSSSQLQHQPHPAKQRRGRVHDTCYTDPKGQLPCN